MSFRVKLNLLATPELAALMKVMVEFQQTTGRQTMPAQYIKAFLHVAMEEGLSVTEYATQSGVSNSVMSRHLLDIGERNRHMKPGFGLVYYKPNPMMLREHQCFLTAKGKALKQRILGILRDAGRPGGPGNSEA